MDGGAWWAAVCGVAKSRTRLSDFTLTFHFHALEKEMATHSSALRDTFAVFVMQGPSEKIANYKPISRLHQILNLLDFQAYRTMRNKFWLCINHPIYDILLQQLEYTETPTGNKTRLFALTTLIPHEARKIYKRLTDWQIKKKTRLVYR